MIKFFRKIRQKLLTENKFSKYMIYAVGEIVLVVIGILIALQINTKNEQRKQNNQLVEIQQRVALDIENDIRELTRNLNFWKEKEPLFKRILNDSISVELLDQGISKLLTESPNTNLNKSGIELLKTLSIRDMLSLSILDIYDRMENEDILPFEEKIEDEIDLIKKSYRDQYDWYPEWMSKIIMKDNSTKELQEYFLYSQEYRHHVIYINSQVFGFYVPRLENYIHTLTETKNLLKVKYDNSIKPISKKELEQYVGIYKIYKKTDGPNPNGVGKTWEFTAFENVLRITDPNSQSNQVFDSFYIDEDTFLMESTDFKIITIFERDDSQNIVGLRFLREYIEGSDILYATKQNED